MERIERYQAAQLHRLMAHAYETVAYYWDVFGGLGLTPGDMKSGRSFVRPRTLR